MFDEFNTSIHQARIVELFEKFNRMAQVNLVGCCNPYKIHTKEHFIGLQNSMIGSVLTHRVFPIKTKLLRYAIDFKQLSEQKESDYLQGILELENIDFEDLNNAEMNDSSAVV